MLCPEDRRPLPGGAVHFLSPLAPRGVRTNFRDLDPVWERERERVNRDALTRLKTPGGVGGDLEATACMAQARESKVQIKPMCLWFVPLELLDPQ